MKFIKNDFFFKKINKKNMFPDLKKIPKKILLYFIQKNPNFDSIKNKSKEELVNIIIENDILCHWTFETYEKCSKQFLKELCKEKGNCEIDILKEKEKMINFLLDRNDENILPKIQKCLREKEDIFVTEEEIKDYL